jgi:hypothetical protein
MESLLVLRPGVVEEAARPGWKKKKDDRPGESGCVQAAFADTVAGGWM